MSFFGCFLDPVSDLVLIDLVQTEALSVVLLLVDAGARGMGMVDGYVGVGWGGGARSGIVLAQFVACVLR